MKIEEVFEKINSTPFLFLGSGITRRYYNLPDWKGLLEHFAYIVKEDEFAYRMYESRALKENNPVGLLPKIADLIQSDFDERWFNDTSIRKIDKYLEERVKQGLSPFKAEIALYIRENSKPLEKYK